jgi:hypothetical protein
VDPAAYLQKVASALAKQGFVVETATVEGRTAVTGTRSDFRWRWFASHLDTSVVAASFAPGEQARESLDAFLSAASSWAVGHRGRHMFGVQSGTAVVAVAVLAGRGEQAERWATEPHGQRFAAIAYPVAVDLEGREVITLRHMVLGRIFAGFLREVVREVIESPLSG